MNEFYINEKLYSLNRAFNVSLWKKKKISESSIDQRIIYLNNQNSLMNASEFFCQAFNIRLHTFNTHIHNKHVGLFIFIIENTVWTFMWEISFIDDQVFCCWCRGMAIKLQISGQFRYFELNSVRWIIIFKDFPDSYRVCLNCWYLSTTIKWTVDYNIQWIDTVYWLCE